MAVFLVLVGSIGVLKDDDDDDAMMIQKKCSDIHLFKCNTGILSRFQACQKPFFQWAYRREIKTVKKQQSGSPLRSVQFL